MKLLMEYTEEDMVAFLKGDAIPYKCTEDVKIMILPLHSTYHNAYGIKWEPWATFGFPHVYLFQFPEWNGILTKGTWTSNIDDYPLQYYTMLSMLNAPEARAF